MKKRPLFQYILLLSLFVVLLTNDATAQNKGLATLDKAGKITLKASSDLTYHNLVDISDLNLTSREKASEYFSKKNTPLVTFEVNEEQQTLDVQIELRARPNWTKEDWNEYLSKL